MPGMIPKFPEFKKLELSDKEDVENFTSQFPPYSDFNFTSMWCWDIKEEMQLSKLKGNLIVKFSDYVTGRPFYSFIGVKDVSDIAQQLLSLSVKEGWDPVLKLLTEETVKRINPDTFIVIEDEDSSDYILSVERLKKYEGGKFVTKRNYLKRFKSAHLSETKLVDLKDPNMKNKIVDLFNLWRTQKGLEVSYAKNELTSLLRFLKLDNYLGFIPVGIFVNDMLIAFWILEQLNEQYSLSHYEKANVGEYTGVYAYLANESAKILDQKKIKYINFEQDLGILGLRESKRSYFPTTYLRQYTLTYRNV